MKAGRRKDYITLRLPLSREEKVPPEAKRLARDRTAHLIARLSHAPLTDLFADAWLQGVTDAGQVLMLKQEPAAGRTPADKGERCMSYSFSVTAATQDEAGKKVEEELAKVVQSQPVHQADRQAAQDAAEGIINSLPAPGEGQEVAVYVSGSVGWSGVYPESHVLTSANVQVSVSVRDKAAS